MISNRIEVKNTNISQGHGNSKKHKLDSIRMTMGKSEECGEVVPCPVQRRVAAQLGLIIVVGNYANFSDIPIFQDKLPTQVFM